MNFDHKSYGRIFTDSQENVEKIKDVIKEMDEYEFGYLPSDLITVYDPESFKKFDDGSVGTADTVYNHKFDDLDLGELMFRCWSKGIKMFCVIGRYGSSKYL